MKVALVHDYLSQDGGAERVLKAMHELWPDAPIFVLFHDSKKITGFKNADIRESFIAKLPFSKTHYRWYLPIMPLATERYDLSGFDVVISSTSAFAKGVLTGPETLHISYCHTPTRYLWSDSHQYVADLKQSWLIKAFLPRLMHRLRLWDKMSADRVDIFLANSRTVAGRIAKYYRRTREVIYPPVNLGAFAQNKTAGDYFAAGGRLVPYKNLDLVVRVFNRLGWPLKIFGDGPELKALRDIAKPNVEFLGRVGEDEKALLLGGARAFIHPQIEDLGITPIEAMAAGRPVIAFNAGGATETVINGKTGVFFNDQTWESLLSALLRFDHLAWDSSLIRSHAAAFSEERFKTGLLACVNNRYEEFKRGISQMPLPV